MRVLILKDGKHFAPEVEQRIAERLGLARGAREFPEFQALLASEFSRWLHDHPALAKKMRGEIEDGRFFIRCPALRLRATRQEGRP